MSWQNHPILTRSDGSYVVTHGGYPYHVPNEGGWLDGTEAVQWPDVHAYATAHPAQVQAEPLPPPPGPEDPVEIRRAEIQARLSALDLASIRPLRALAEGTGTPEDSARLAELEVEAAALRAELAGLA